jgi:hypothetical protein
MATKIINLSDVQRLAERFMTRGTSGQFAGQPELQEDFWVVGGLLQSWLQDDTILSGPFYVVEPTIEDGSQRYEQMRKDDPA